MTHTFVQVDDYRRYIHEKIKDGQCYVSDKIKDGQRYVSDKIKDGQRYVSDKIKDGQRYVSDKIKDGQRYVSDKVDEGQTYINEWMSRLKDKFKIKKPGKQTSMMGDPHFRSVDGLDYTFNGAGEFWMLMSSTEQPLTIQGRFEKFHSGSILSALVMKEPWSSAVQIQASSVRTIDVLVDGIAMVLDYPETRRVQFQNVIVSVSDDRHTVKVHFLSGFFIVVRTMFNFGLTMQIPKEYVGTMHGLFGTYDDDRENDLTARNGTVLDPDTATMAQIHYDFGMTWMVAENETLFTYLGKTNYSTYCHPDFRPHFYERVNAPSSYSSAARAFCGIDTACMYDYDATNGDQQFANRTLVQSMEYNASRAIFDQPLSPICPAPPNPTNGQCQAEEFFTVGSRAHCHCFSGFNISLGSINTNSLTLVCALDANETLADWKIHDENGTMRENERQMLEQALLQFSTWKIFYDVVNIGTFCVNATAQAQTEAVTTTATTTAEAAATTTTEASDADDNGDDKKLPDEFLGSWTLKNTENFEDYLNARFSWLTRNMARIGMSKKTIFLKPNGKYSWDGLYPDMELGKEFACVSINCVFEYKNILFTYSPADRTLTEMHTSKFNGQEILSYRYKIDNGMLVMKTKWSNVSTTLIYRKND